MCICVYGIQNAYMTSVFVSNRYTNIHVYVYICIFVYVYIGIHIYTYTQKIVVDTLIGIRYIKFIKMNKEKATKSANS